MGIVNPRPPMRRKEARTIYERMRLHMEFMERLEAEGMSREDASRKAFFMVKAGGKWIPPEERQQ